MNVIIAVVHFFPFSFMGTLAAIFLSLDIGDYNLVVIVHLLVNIGFAEHFKANTSADHEGNKDYFKETFSKTGEQKFFTVSLMDMIFITRVFVEEFKHAVIFRDFVISGNIYWPGTKATKAKQVYLYHFSLETEINIILAIGQQYFAGALSGFRWVDISA